MIDLNKQYRSKDGRKIKLAFIDENVVYGFYELPDGSWKGTAWHLIDGAYKNNHFPHELDFVEVKPRIKKTVWMNIYESDFFIWPTKSKADFEEELTKVNHDFCRIACVKVEIDCEEGEGL
jgi:hypothetical protein